MRTLQVTGPTFGAYGGIVRAGVTFLLAFVVLYLLGRFLLVPAVERSLAARGYDETLRSLAAKVTRAVVVATAIAIGFTLAGYGAVLSSLAILGGAFALALGFAAQDLVGNFVAGVFILRDKPFVVGDWIAWDGGEGVVDDVDLRVTRVRTFDNEMVTVPNGTLANTAVTNPVAYGTLRLRETFGVGYEDDVDRVTEILVEEARAHDDVLNEPEPSVRLVEFGDSAVGLQAGIWIRDPTAGAASRVRSEYARAVKERFDDEGIDMPYPHTQLTGGIDVATVEPDSGVPESN